MKHAAWVPTRRYWSRGLIWRLRREEAKNRRDSTEGTQLLSGVSSNVI